MNKKNIERHLNKKFHDFASSIKDDEVRDLVKDNSLICGGAIASLLMGEKVNDYDIYFTNMETVVKVAEYYVAQYRKINKNPSGNIEVKTYENRVSIQIKSSGISSNTDENYQYFESTDGDEAQSFIENTLEGLDDIPADQLKDHHEQEEEKLYIPLFLTQNAITLSDDIQLVIRFFGSSSEIHENFDYEHTKMSWNSRTGTLTTRKSALESLITKDLQYTGSKYPLCSLFRMRKYINRGWTINAGQIFKMGYQISNLNLSDTDILEDQLIGVDTAYFSELVSILREDKKDGKSIDQTYIMSLVDKIF